MKFQWKVVDLSLLTFSLFTFIFCITIYCVYNILLNILIITIILADILFLITRLFGYNRDMDNVKRGKYDINKIRKGVKISIVAFILIIIFVLITGYEVITTNINLLDLYYYQINKGLFTTKIGIYLFCFYFFILSIIGWLGQLWTIIWQKGFIKQNLLNR